MKNYLVGGAALLVLSACASQPDPVPEVAQAPAPVTEAAPPQIFEPVPVAPPPIVEAPQSAEVLPDPNLPTPGSVEDFAFQSGGEPRIFFGYDQYDLTPEARNVLRSQADWLKQYDSATAVIEGHADERGTREYNLALGARRASSVQAFLISQGIAPNRLRTISYGKERPIDGRPSEAGWARNRNGYTNLNLGGVS